MVGRRAKMTAGLESPGCLLGCKAPSQRVLVGRDRLHGHPGEFQVVRCLECGLMRTDPRPDVRAMSAYYPEEYLPYLGTRIRADLDNRPHWRRRLSTMAGRIFDTRAAELPPMNPGRLLEIGCASGGYLHAMAARGWKVEGIEFSESAAAAARSAGYTVQTGPVETARAPENAPDLIVAWMVLEHLHDPVLALRRLATWAAPDAWLVVSVPNASSWEFRAFRSAWYALLLPTHLWHPTRDDVAKVLRRGGWKVERMIYHRDLRNVLGSLGLLLEDYGRAPRLSAWLKEFPLKGGRVAQLLFPLAWLMAALGQTGRMTVWARLSGD